MENNSEAVKKGLMPFNKKTPPPIVVQAAGKEGGTIKFIALSKSKDETIRELEDK